MLGTAIFKKHSLGPKPRKLKIEGPKNLGNAQVANRIGAPKKLAKTLKSTYEGVYFLVKLKFHAESLLKT